MVQVVLRIDTVPGRTTEMVRSLRTLMLPLQAAPGFSACHLYRDADRPETLCYIEEWQTPQDLDREVRSARYTRLLALIEEAAESPDLRINWVMDVKGLEYLEHLRLDEP